MYFKVSPDMEVLRWSAKKVRLTGLSLADRVLVTFAPGMPEARRIVLTDSLHLRYSLH